MVLDSLLPEVRLRITGPLDVWMLDALGRASRDFCRRSELITLHRTAELVQDQAETVCDQDDLQAALLLYLTDADGHGLVAGRDYDAPSPNRVIPLRNLTATLWYVAEPSPGAESYPDLLGEHFADVLAAGAAHYLYLMPDKPWTDPRRASVQEVEFVEGIRRATRFRKAHAAPQQLEYRNPVRRRLFI